MAHLISLERLESLLVEARRRGAGFAWIDDGVLKLGAAPDAPAFAIDLGSETLTQMRAQPQRQGHGGARPPGGEHVAPAPAPPPSPAPSGDADEVLPRLPEQFELPAFSGRRTGAYRLVMEGTTYAAKSQKELLLIGLSVAERARPGTLAKLAADKTRTKRAVARNREALNDNPALAVRFSHCIEGGWWVFTNNSFAETEKFVRRAGFYAGLHVHIDKFA